MQSGFGLCAVWVPLLFEEWEYFQCTRSLRAERFDTQARPWRDPAGPFLGEGGRAPALSPRLPARRPDGPQFSELWPLGAAPSQPAGKRL